MLVLGSPKEVSRLWGVNEATVRGWCKRGQLHAHKVKGRWICYHYVSAAEYAAGWEPPQADDTRFKSGGAS